MKIKGNRTSSFWLDNSYWGGSSYSTKAERSSSDLLKMASIRRSISNFVTIVTGQNIPVKFKTKGMSATDGKTVTISSDLTKFDTVCGLALHEASHIKLSSFQLLKDLHKNPARFFSRKFKKDMSIKYNMSELDVCSKVLGPRIKSFTNYVEDRRIDNYIYTNAPGYQGYYDSMYDEYWNSDSISEGLKSAAMRDEIWESYEFRVINLTNPDTDFDALKGLKKIYKILNLADIERLTTSRQALDVAISMYEVLEKYISITPPQDSDEDGEGEEGDGEGESEEGEGTPPPDAKEKKGKGDSEDKDGDPEENDSEDGEGDEDKPGSPGPNVEGDGSGKTSKVPPPILSDKQMEDLVDAIDTQKKFLDNETDDKKELSDEQKEMVESMEEAGTEQKEVCQNSNMLDRSFKSCPVIVVKEFNKRILDSNPFDIFNTYANNENEVKAGFVLGRQLGKKLQIRNEEQTLKTTRLRTGKIDDRLIHSLGYGAEQVFERTFVDVYNPLHLHISIDASGSMSGSKWNKTQTAVIAIAVAASMVSNLNVVISYRYTCTTRSDKGYGYHSHKPLVLIAYDSKKDDVTKIKQLFPYLHAPSGTPEGLCFEATLDLMVSGTNTQDSYFINFSDGEPYFSNNQISYSGANAYKHTKKMMDAFRHRGINILSYFIGSEYGGSMDNFKRMYGKDAVNVEVTNLIPLAKTLNKLFLKK